MKHDFYTIGFNSNNVELFVEVIGKYDDQKLMTGEFNPNPLKVKKSQGRKAYDIIRLQDVFNFLISKKLRENLEKADLSGWKTYKIESEDIDKEYEGFQCMGKCGKPIRPRYKGFVTGYKFDEKTWDGSDFFIPESTLMIICTQKAMEIVEQFKIKNIQIENIKRHEWFNA